MGYSQYELKVAEYWKVLSRTRASGRISQSIKDKEEEYWSQFPKEVVEEALEIHMKRYPDRKEAYTRGIIRNLARQKKPVSSNKFNNMESRSYDMDSLEKALLGVQ